MHGSGRTDAGVHALAQVASVTLTATHDPSAIQRGLNAVLPPAVRVTAIEDAPPGFHARFAALGKVYEYRVVNAPFVSPFCARYAWHVAQPIDLLAMREAGAGLIGRHDFAAFQGTGSGTEETVRTLAALEWTDGQGPDRPLVIRLTADGFLRHMVRNIVGHAGRHRAGTLGAGRDPRHPRVARSSSRRPDGAAARPLPDRGALRRGGCFIMQSTSAAALLTSRSSLYHRGLISPT